MSGRGADSSHISNISLRAAQHMLSIDTAASAHRVPVTAQTKKPPRPTYSEIGTGLIISGAFVAAILGFIIPYWNTGARLSPLDSTVYLQHTTPIIPSGGDHSRHGHNTSLPNITIFATGGTIPGQSISPTNNGNYDLTASAQDLLAAMPEIKTYANIQTRQLSQVLSTDLTQQTLLTLQRAVAAELAKQEVTGVVITHGTDTLEETCFHLELTINTSKPIVCAAATRPATALSADGAANLLQSVVLATAANGRDRGVMIIVNDKISSAFFAAKNPASHANTFYNAEVGTIGYFLDHRPYFYFTPSRAVGAPYLDISSARSLPQVEILYSHPEQNPGLVEAAVQLGAKGIVFAANGDGSVPVGVLKAAEVVQRKGVVVVVTYKVPNGCAVPSGIAIASAHLNPVKARILLRVALARGMDHGRICALFDRLRPDPWTVC
ncbi:hypothetical protein LTR62_006623 [Meristemomyces frigidus]|uniref:asparaginase n=1 Tax=Meristemomyces frigidus TaxID=1508187 RepID=A0AAN7THL8_9PEZI|nr:hypothetical protein LTR62_006623 [Meristemomyces frigidus]